MKLDDIIKSLSKEDKKTFDIEYEKKRIEEFNKSKIETMTSKLLEKIVVLVAQIFEVPIVLLSIVQDDKQWFKYKIGTDLNDTSRCQSFCSYNIKDEDLLCITDATKDIRFKDNDLVRGEPYIKFYAGFPVHSNQIRIGSICLIDDKPRNLNDKEFVMLQSLRDIIDTEIELHNNHINTNDLYQKLYVDVKNKDLTFASINHDIKNIVNSIMMGQEILNKTHDEEVNEIIQNGMKQIIMLTESISDLYKKDNELMKLDYKLYRLKDIIEQLKYDSRIIIEYNEHENDIIECDKIKLIRALGNFITNSLKFIPKNGKIVIKTEKYILDKKYVYDIYIQDNGPGLNDDNKKDIIGLFSNKSDINLLRSTKLGLGLFISNDIIRHHKGNVQYIETEGCLFKITIPTFSTNRCLQLTEASKGTSL